MAIKYQFNKVAMQELSKQLRIREAALPTLKSKESALRLMIKKERANLAKLEENFKNEVEKLNSYIKLWSEFPEQIFNLKEVLLSIQKIAGVKVFGLNEVKIEVSDFSLFTTPLWTVYGIDVLKNLTKIIAEMEIMKKKIEILEYARRKTTQKVNLYEKIQIPAYAEAIRKIKRYLEDVDNLEKSAQKITKARQAGS